MYDKLNQHLVATQLIPENSSLVVAVSGGVDSVALLDLLANLEDKWGWEITIAHLNHNVRADSDIDANLVARLAERYGYKLYLNQLDNPNPSEGSLRKARYEFLETVREGANADYIVVAHHSDDRLETSFLNVIRGADRYGITALKPQQNNIIRPLLGFSKSQLIMHAITNELEYNDDATNQDPSYRRNLIRHYVLPNLSNEEPDFSHNYSNSLNDLEKLTYHIDWQLERLLDSMAIDIKEDAIYLNRAKFLKLTKLVQTNLIAYCVRQLTGGLAITAANLETVVGFFQSAKTGTFSNAIPKLICERNYDTLVLILSDRKVHLHQPTLPLRPNRSVIREGYKISLNQSPILTSAPNYLIKPSALYIRGWQAGDKIRPVGMTGSRKIQDIFTDKKIERHKRNNWPIIVTPLNNIIGICGIMIDRTSLASPQEPHYQLIIEEV